jgi:hypothetical protein
VDCRAKGICSNFAVGFIGIEILEVSLLYSYIGDIKFVG